MARKKVKEQTRKPANKAFKFSRLPQNTRLLVLVAILALVSTLALLQNKHRIPPGVSSQDIKSAEANQPAPPGPDAGTSPVAVATVQPAVSPSSTPIATPTPAPKNIQTYSISILPGYNLITIPVALENDTIQAVFGTQLTGGNSVDTGDRVLVWDESAQDYIKAVYVDGTGTSKDGKWYNEADFPNTLSTISFSLHQGFWVQHRGGTSKSVTIYGNPVAGTLPSVSVGSGNWQLAGTTYLSSIQLETSGLQVHGTEDPSTSDRILYWDAATQQYVSAWYCDGPVCQEWGEPWYHHWLANDYSQSTVVLDPWHGFWIQVRGGASGDTAPATP